MHGPLGPIVVRREPLNVRNFQLSPLADVLVGKPLSATAGSIKRDKMLGSEILFEASGTGNLREARSRQKRAIPLRWNMLSIKLSIFYEAIKCKKQGIYPPALNPLAGKAG